MTEKKAKPQGWSKFEPQQPGAVISSFDGVRRTPEADDELNKLFASIFAGKKGELALAYLRSITKDLVLGDGLGTTQLIHLEGQRFLCHLMERRAEHGRRK